MRDVRNHAKCAVKAKTFANAALMALALIGGSATAAPARAYDTGVYLLVTHDDKFAKSISFSGRPEWVLKLFGTKWMWNLRSWIDKATLTVTHQLYVDISYEGSWAFYQSAADDHANDLPLTKISQEVGSCGGLMGCDLTEDVGVELDDSMLRARALTGFQIKLSAKSGDSVIVDVTPSQIQSELVTANQFLPTDRQWSAPASQAASSSSQGPSTAAPTQTMAPAGDSDAPPWGPMAFGAPTTLTSSKSRVEAMQALKALLTSSGWTLDTYDEPAGRIVTTYRDTKLSIGQVNCGEMLMIPYILDDRAKVQTVLDFTVADQVVIGREGVRGYYKTGYGNPDKPLTCSLKTAFPRQDYEPVLNATAVAATH
jgi:hypothetical protein